MKKKIFYILYVVMAMIAWAGIVITGTFNGWFHTCIAERHTPHAFTGAIDQEIKKASVGNFALALFQEGNITHEKFYSKGKRVDRNTVFLVASISKWISAFGIMKLVEDGKLALDTPVSTYLTRWKLPAGEFNNDDVTVRRLLSHTAGLTDGLGYSGFAYGTPLQPIEESLSQAIDADEGVSGKTSVGISPGSTFKYSGGGYTLLQLLVEEVSHQSFDSYMKEHIFKPLKMVHSCYVLNDTASVSLAESYTSSGSKADYYQYTSLAATSLYTSLSDLELFFQAHLPGKNKEPVGRNVLKPETISIMRKPHARQMGIDIWGLGTILYAPVKNDFIIGHDGKSTPAINTAVRLNPETGDGIIVLETGNPLLATRLASEWVFWKTGVVDTLLFPMLINGMFWALGLGWILVIVICSMLFIRTRR